MLSLRSLIIACVLAGVFAGCATTQPWEREHLAEPVMATDPDPDRALLVDHVRTTREGAIGGVGGGGGGCGCN